MAVFSADIVGQRTCSYVLILFWQKSTIDYTNSGASIKVFGKFSANSLNMGGGTSCEKGSLS